MSWFLKEYLERGLREIVVVASHDEEKEDSTHTSPLGHDSKKSGRS
jgi:hypothetical protein